MDDSDDEDVDFLNEEKVDTTSFTPDENTGDPTDGEDNEDEDEDEEEAEEEKPPTPKKKKKKKVVRRKKKSTS